MYKGMLNSEGRPAGIEEALLVIFGYQSTARMHEQGNGLKLSMLCEMQYAVMVR